MQIMREIWKHIWESSLCERDEWAKGEGRRVAEEDVCMFKPNRGTRRREWKKENRVDFFDMQMSWCETIPLLGLTLPSDGIQSD